MSIEIHTQERASVPSTFAGKAALLSAALLLGGFSTQAVAQNYSVFNTVLKQTGTPSEDGTQITYALVRQDLTGLTIKLNGASTAPAVPESVATGYIGLQQIGTAGSIYYVDGSFPAVAKELPVLEAALALTGIPITAIADEAAGLSKTVYHVHIAGTVATPTARVLANSLATALATINKPQLNVSIVYPGVIFSGVPKKFQRLVDPATGGVYRLINNNAVVFSISRNDKNDLTLGAPAVPATQSLGVGETIYITGDGNTSLINVELALKTSEVAEAQQTLLAAGYTLSAQTNHFTVESKPLTFLHAVVSGTSQDQLYEQLEPLGDLLLKIVKK